MWSAIANNTIRTSIPLSKTISISLQYYKCSSFILVQDFSTSLGRQEEQYIYLQSTLLFHYPNDKKKSQRQKNKIIRTPSVPLDPVLTSTEGGAPKKDISVARTDDGASRGENILMPPPLATYLLPGERTWRAFKSPRYNKRRNRRRRSRREARGYRDAASPEKLRRGARPQERCDIYGVIMPARRVKRALSLSLSILFLYKPLFVASLLRRGAL